MDCRLPELSLPARFIEHKSPDVFSSKSIHPSDNNLKFTLIKTASFALQIFLFLGSLFLLIPILRQLILLVLPKEFSQERQIFVQKIEERKIEVLSRTFDEFKALSCQDLEGLEEDSKFETELKRLFKCLEKKENSLKIQHSLKKIYETKSYREMMESSVKHPLLTLFHRLGTALRTDVIGMDILREYGKTILEKGNLPDFKDREITWHEMGNFMVETFNNRSSPSFDTPLEMGFFLLQDLSLLFSAPKIVGLFGSSVEDFNPYERGNFNLATLDYIFGDQTERKVRFFHGPGPGITSDRMLSLQLDSLKANENGLHLQHSMENYNKPGERQRLHQLKTFEENSKDKMRLFLTPVDGDIWHMKSDYANWSSASQFLAKYKQAAIRGESDQKGYRTLFDPSNLPKESFYIGKDVMSDEQFESGFDLAADIFDEASLLQNPYWNEMISKGNEGKRILAKGLQVFVQALTSIGAMAKLAKDGEGQEGPLTFGQACMEDIDRGAAVNVATRLLMMRLSGQKIKASELSEIIGTIIGRAELSSGRRIMKDRFEGLASFIFLVGSHPEEKVDESLKAHFKKMFFDNEEFSASIASLN
ncbi:hypothetical protein [Criblamydia sequanensis]|uniref:Membrane protein n=1 Tax=Candidatus Criblamydia sequanensis CRIB-18 TaxID=1437425 RepID=A0A090D2X5_9BACT|nr:hypothetical protein [Criblamydia sequanensis]CDR35035.1 putative membrane protein [Criblamydia sequanensis CRIB-18]